LLPLLQLPAEHFPSAVHVAQLVVQDWHFPAAAGFQFTPVVAVALHATQLPLVARLKPAAQLPASHLVLSVSHLLQLLGHATQALAFFPNPVLQKVQTVAEVQVAQLAEHATHEVALASAKYCLQPPTAQVVFEAQVSQLATHVVQDPSFQASHHLPSPTAFPTSPVPALADLMLPHWTHLLLEFSRKPLTQ